MTTLQSEVHWKEDNAVFGEHNHVPHDYLSDAGADTESSSFKSIVFDFDELTHHKPITLRTKAGVAGSTGLAIWTCSQILAGYLLENPHKVRSQHSVLELGSGLGLCSIVAHQLGVPKVLATDGDVHVLQNLRHNARCNAIRHHTSPSILHCPQLIWGKQEQLDEIERLHKLQPVILATDVFYTPQSIQPLWQTVDQLLEPNGEFLLAFAPHEVSIAQVLDVARDMDFTWTCPNIGELECDDATQDNDEDLFDDPVPNSTNFGYHLFRFKRRDTQ